MVNVTVIDKNNSIYIKSIIEPKDLKCNLMVEGEKLPLRYYSTYHSTENFTNKENALKHLKENKPHGHFEIATGLANKENLIKERMFMVISPNSFLDIINNMSYEFGSRDSNVDLKYNKYIYTGRIQE